MIPKNTHLVRIGLKRNVRLCGTLHYSVENELRVSLVVFTERNKKLTCFCCHRAGRLKGRQVGWQPKPPVPHRSRRRRNCSRKIHSRSHCKHPHWHLHWKEHRGSSIKNITYVFDWNLTLTLKSVKSNSCANAEVYTLLRVSLQR